MITDVQLGVMANIVGVTIFVLVILFHYIIANDKKLSKEHGKKE
jgi:hypothetical protein